MKAIFSFFKAGQGSFYGGRIFDYETRRLFTVVYDCGTSPFIAGNSQSLNKEIDNFKNSPRHYPYSKEIDLLFISHLDYDHVSGLNRMLTEFKVKNIVLPHIEEQHRRFFLVSLNSVNSPKDLTPELYISFIKSPHSFIQKKSKNEDTKIFYVKSNGKSDVEYQSYDNKYQNEYFYPRGTKNAPLDESTNGQSVSVYDNNLQFFIKRKWEFTTYVRSVSDKAILKLHNCLKKKLNKKADEDLTFADLEEIVNTKRKEAHKCYTDCIGEINSHGLVLLHGPIHFEELSGRFVSDFELNHFKNNCRHYNYSYRNKKPIMLGTLLFGDTSINPNNNPIDFPQAFKDKLVNVHLVQVPHHGSSKNWDFDEFKKLKIGDKINRWENISVAVCNFGYGNKYGHPSHEVLNDLHSTIFLNSQFSRLDVEYDISHWRP